MDPHEAFLGPLVRWRGLERGPNQPPSLADLPGAKVNCRAARVMRRIPREQLVGEAAYAVDHSLWLPALTQVHGNVRCLRTPTRFTRAGHGPIGEEVFGLCALWRSTAQ